MVKKTTRTKKSPELPENENIEFYKGLIRQQRKQLKNLQKNIEKLNNKIDKLTKGKPEKKRIKKPKEKPVDKVTQIREEMRRVYGAKNKKYGKKTQESTD